MSNKLLTRKHIYLDWATVPTPHVVGVWVLMLEEDEAEDNTVYADLEYQHSRRGPLAGGPLCSALPTYGYSIHDILRVPEDVLEWARDCKRAFERVLEISA